MLTPNMFEEFIPTILMFVVPALAIVIILSIFKTLLGSTKSTKDNYKYQKRNLLTNNELNFYRSLYPIATKKGFLLFTKIRLADLVEPKKGTNNWQASFNKIQSKHVDFVLCDSVKINPLLVIELDDKTHNQPDRKNRDAFVDQALASASIPILHTRTTEKLEEMIMAKIYTKTPLTNNAKK